MLSIIFEFNGTTDGLVEVLLRRTRSNCRYDDQQNIFSSSITAMATLISTIFQLINIPDKSSTDSPTMAHAALREIVEKAVEEARKLPELNASEDTEQLQEERAVTDDSYEDLLATAILNKVV